MHIPDSMLHGAVCPVTVTVAVGGVATAAVWAAKAWNKDRVNRFAVVAALVFAGQMVNFPVPFGTSGHLLGGVLAAALLGTPLAVLALTLVLSIQALMFGDGGLLALGANVTNMALIGVGVGALMNYFVGRNRAMPLWRRSLLFGLAGWLSVMLAALGVCAELSASGSVALGRVVPTMLSVHAWIGIGEGLITGMVFLLLAGEEKNTQGFSRRMALTFAAACGTVLFLGPLASKFPDGLENAAHLLNIATGTEVGRYVPLAGYRFPAVGSLALGTALAGFAGVLLTFGSALLVGREIEGRGQDRCS